MEHGFTTVKDVLDVLVVPLVIFLLGIFWPLIQAQYRCNRFRRLARRELEEITPFQNPKKKEDWTNHLTKDFVHKQIIENASDNRDFLLGLDPEFVYWLSNLWSAYKSKDGGQWLHYLTELSTHRYTKSEDLAKALPKWKKIIYGYKADNETTDT